eukprot:scaffold114051_cov73-Cyclotella_meneghiniana.AAC.3
MKASLLRLGCLPLCLLLKADGFSGPRVFQTARIQTITPSLPLQKSSLLPSSSITNHHGSWSTLQMASYYAPPEDSPQQSGVPSPSSSKKLPTPKIGDIVLYYDLDGGSSTGQTLVGKLSLIQPIKSSNGNTSNNTKTNDDDGTNKWLVEITQLENVGEGYYAEYPSRKRRKVDLRKLEQVAPLAASFVRTEDAYKVPLGTDNNTPVSYAPYDVRGYTGPMSVPINNDIVEADGILYNNVKLTLFKNTALAGLIGTIIADLLKGTEDAVIYFAGATAGLLYLYFLGIKTDTVGSVDAKLGANVSNLRFVFPALVLIGVAINNVVLSGSNNPVVNAGLFSTVTPEQFGAAMIGFLTYRIPLFVGNLFPVLFDTTADVVLPGSAGMAVRMAAEAKQRGVDVSALDGTENAEDGLVTVLLVSGPEGSGKSTLVNRLLEEDDRFVRPVMNDRIVDGIKFELMEQRDEFLTMDESGRYGLSKDGVLQAASEASGNSDSSKVVVIDADVPLAKKLANLPEARLIGVWVGLDSREKFEDRLKSKIRSGSITVSEDETEDSLVRAKMNQAIKDIEYGVVSGVFEFTILNDDIDESVKELKEAAEYCFR